MVREQLGAEALPVYELSELLVDVLGGGGRGRVLPAPGHLPPDLPLAAGAAAWATGRCGCCRSVRGIDLVELPDALECCGFGGTFAVKNADVSTAMLSDKMRDVLDTRAEVVCAVDSSCLMHIGGGLSRGRTGVRTVHLAEILASTEDEPWRRERFPGRRARCACRQPAARQPRRAPPRRSATSARGWWRSCRTGRSCGPRARRSRTRRCCGSTRCSSGSSRR